MTPRRYATGAICGWRWRSFPDNFNGLNIDGNTADTGDILAPTLPGAFISQADGSLKLNTDYFTGAELTGTNPQVVTYTINPKATWNDGAPITWEDLKSETEACSGHDERFLIASNAGFDRVKSVTRGVDDRQAVVTFSQPYAEWQGMFAGGIQPRSMTANPDAFNKGQLDAPGPSAGPFIVSTIDRARNESCLPAIRDGGAANHGWTPSRSWSWTPPPRFRPCRTTILTPPA